MRRTTVFLSEQIDSDLHAVARRQKRPLSALLREALERFLAEETSRDARSPRFVGIGASGRRDTAERHEELLFQELEPHGSDRLRPRRAGLRPRRR